MRFACVRHLQTSHGCSLATGPPLLARLSGRKEELENLLLAQDIRRSLWQREVERVDGSIELSLFFVFFFCVPEKRFQGFFFIFFLKLSVHI